MCAGARETITITQTVHNDSPIDITPSRSPIARNLDTHNTRRRAEHTAQAARMEWRGNKSDINLMGHCTAPSPPSSHSRVTRAHSDDEWRRARRERERGADEKHTLNGHTNDGHKKRGGCDGDGYRLLKSSVRGGRTRPICRLSAFDVT